MASVIEKSADRAQMRSKRNLLGIDPILISVIMQSLMSFLATCWKQTPASANDGHADAQAYLRANYNPDSGDFGPGVYKRVMPNAMKIAKRKAREKKERPPKRDAVMVIVHGSLMEAMTTEPKTLAKAMSEAEPEPENSDSTGGNE